MAAGIGASRSGRHTCLWALKLLLLTLSVGCGRGAVDAAQSIRCRHAFAPAPWTLPSHVGMFSRQHPFDAGIADFELFNRELDPIERRPIENPEVERALRTALEARPTRDALRSDADAASGRLNEER